MPTRVRLPDGRVVTVQTDDPDEAARAAHRFQQDNPAPRQETPRNYPSWRPESFSDLVREAPSQDYRAGHDRRAQERAPRGRPGTFLRGLEDFNREGLGALLPQMMRNIGIADDVAALSERAQGATPEQARGAADYERDEQARIAQEHPVLNTGSIAASIPALGGTPVAGLGRIGMLQAGGAAAGVNAPFALARQEGTLQERLPGALRETAVVGGLGAALQGGANLLMRAPRPGAANARTRAADFQAAGVRPTLAAVSQGTPAGVTRMISENFLAGAPARGRLQASLDDTANAARNLSARAGQAAPREVVGEGVQAAARRFDDASVPNPRPRADPRTVPVRDWSFKAKAGALYDDVFERLAYDEGQMIGAVEGPILSLDATRRVLEQIDTRVHGPASRDVMTNPLVERMRAALASDEALGELRFHDLRAWRTWLREAQSSPQLGQSIPEADLRRLEGALTEDIYASAMNIGGQAAQDLRRVDQFYRAGMGRIERALRPLTREGVGGAQAYRRIIDLASQGGRQNTRTLQSIRNSLTADDWRTVSATVIDELGSPSFGHPQVMEAGTFSVERFVTNYARLSPEGRRILFGPLVGELDTLARVAGAQKGVEAMANRSRSGVNAQNILTLGAFATPGGAGWATLGLAGMAITGEMLTNPAFVRWLTSAPRVGASPGGMRRHLAALAQIAARDPALAPLYAQLTERGGGQSHAPETRQAASAPQ